MSGGRRLTSSSLLFRVELALPGGRLCPVTVRLQRPVLAVVPTGFAQDPGCLAPLGLVIPSPVSAVQRGLDSVSFAQGTRQCHAVQKPGPVSGLLMQPEFPKK